MITPETLVVVLGALTGAFATSGLALQLYADRLDERASPWEPPVGTFLSSNAGYDRGEIRVLRRSRQRGIARRISRLSSVVLYLSVVSGLGVSFPPISAYALILSGIVLVVVSLAVAQLQILTDAGRAEDATHVERYREKYNATIPPDEGLAPVKRGPSFIGPE